MTKAGAPKAFHIMVKPTGSACNLDCAYCFFLKKDSLYPGSTFRMSNEVHDAYIRQLMDGHDVPEVTVAWQGGEPTLMGLDFFRHSVELQRKYKKPGTRVENTFQTNGVLLDDEWCSFFRENGFLIGLSIDGPRELHDYYRRDKAGHGTFDKALRAARLLQKHGVEYNILCTVNSKNSGSPLDIYRFFRDELGAHYIQFIPVVERDEDGGVTERSVGPEAWGRFLTEIFDEWVVRDVGETFVINFDGALAGWLDMAGTLCIFGQRCGLGMALEHNGDLYSCDHFVDHGHFLGNIMETPMAELVASEKQSGFGADKCESLPRTCHECEYLFVCNGECPKNRLVEDAGGGRLNYLCTGYKAFFRHADERMRIMAELIRKGQPASDVMDILRPREANGFNGYAKAGMNDPCFCGSGMKFKKCHGGSY